MLRRSTLTWNIVEKLPKTGSSWKEKYNNYFVISRLDRETPKFQLAMFKHTIGDDALKVIKTFNYAEGVNSSDWRIVMGKMEKHCIGEVNKICERYCFNMRDKLPTESIDSFVAELRNLAKTCNFCDCLRDSLIRDTLSSFLIPSTIETQRHAKIYTNRHLQVHAWKHSTSRPIRCLRCRTHLSRPILYRHRDRRSTRVRQQPKRLQDYVLS